MLKLKQHVNFIDSYKVENLYEMKLALNQILKMLATWQLWSKSVQEEQIIILFRVNSCHLVTTIQQIRPSVTLAEDTFSDLIRIL